MNTDSSSELRQLPSVDKVLGDPRLREGENKLSREVLAELVREKLADTRQRVASGGENPGLDGIVGMVLEEAATFGGSLRKVINATGVVLHTNLGRAPMSEETIRAMAETSRGYNNLELDLETGARGSRHVHAESLLCRLSGAEAAMVVNNNAAGVLLGLSALAKGKEVIVSRGQAVQIGGGVRIPDIMRQSGAKLAEVGTTNVTTLSDYSEAIGPKTAALLKVHSSNFKIVGFTEQTAVQEMARLAGERGVLLLDDLGSGCFMDTTKYGLDPEPTVQESVKARSDAVFFSGDKLMGGPQAGLIVGKKAALDKLKKHPLARAMRIDRTRLAGVVATAMHYLMGNAETAVPVWRMISMPLKDIEARARRWAGALGEGVLVGRGESVVGGGSLPGGSLPTWLLVIPEAGGRGKKTLPDLSYRLRHSDPAVVCRIEKDRLLVDPRTVAADEEDKLVAALKAARAL